MTARMGFLAKLLPLLILTGSCGEERQRSAEQSTPTTPTRGDTVATTTRKVRVGEVEIVLDSNFTLASVQALLSTDSPRPPRRDSEGRSVCFRLGASNLEGWLVLSSNALGGPDGYVLGYEVRGPEAPPSESANCLNSHYSLATVKTDVGVSVGMPLAEMRRVLGEPARVSGDSLIYDRSYSIMDSTATRGVVERYIVSLLVLQGSDSGIRFVSGWFVITT